MYIIFSYILNIFYLFRSRLRFLTKIGLFFLYILYLILYPILRILNIKTIYFGGKKIYGSSFGINFFLYGEIFIKNEYEPYYDYKKPIILDIGANMGFTSIYFKNIFRESHIYAFEPDMKAFHILEKNIKYRNLKDISIFNVAVTDKKGEIDFFTNETVGLQMSINEKRSNVKKTTVNTISLSEFIKNNNLHIDILKIDIEGAETIVFRDLYKNNCLNKINEILIEYHHNIEESPNHLSEFLQMIENSGFDYQISSNYLNKNKPKEFQDISIHAYKKI